MKNLILLILGLFWCSSANAKNCSSDPNLISQLIQLGVTSNEDCLKDVAAIKNGTPMPNVPNRNLTSKDVYFLLYTRNNMNKPQNFSSTDANKLKESYFDKNKRTVMHIHGSNDSPYGIASKIKSDLLILADINVFLVGWESIANYSLSYDRGIAAPFVGITTGNFINNVLVFNDKTTPGKLVLTGHSSGAQACGFAGKKVPGISEIIGVDPVGPCFATQPPTKRLAKTDALYVQIMHCSIGDRGLPYNYSGSHQTFYFDVCGVYQQQCYGSNLNNVSLCSHQACLDYFVDSILNPGHYIGVSGPDKNDCATAGYHGSPLKPGDWYVSNCTSCGANNNYYLQRCNRYSINSE